MIAHTVNDLGISESTADLQAACAGWGLATQQNQNVWYVDGVRTPSATAQIVDLVGRTLYSQDKRMVYNLMSASAHGTLYGLLRAYVPDEPTEAGEPTVVRQIDHRIIESSVGVAVMSFLANLNRVVDLMGWSWIKVTSLSKMAGALIQEGPR